MRRWLSRIMLRLRGTLTRSTFLHPRTQDERNVRLLYLNTAMIGVPAGGIMAFLSVFLARLGASSTMIGWLTSAPGLLSFFLLIPGAAIAERSANQVAVRVRYAKITRLSYLLCAIAPFVVPTASLPLVIVIIWSAKTFSDAVTIPSWTAVISQAVPPRKRSQLNGTRWALLSIMSALSSFLFGWLLDVVVFPLNYQIVFLISFIVGWFDPVLFSHIVVPDVETIASASKNILRRFQEYLQPVMAHRIFWVYLGATMLYRIALNMPAPLFSIFWVNDLQATDSLIGLRGTVGHSALVVGYIFWGRSANRMGRRKVLVLAAAGLATYPILTALAPTSIWILPIAAIWGLTASGIDIGIFDMMLSAMPDKRRPLFAAVWGMGGNLAIFAGPLIGAAVANSTSTATALIIAGVLQLVAILPMRLAPDSTSE